MRARWLGPALAAGLALAACGGDGGGSATDSKAEFVAAADRICVERDQSAGRLRPAGSVADFGRLSGQLAAIYDKTIADVQALELPPGAARAGAQRFVTTTVALRRPVDRMKASARRLEAAAEANDGAELKAASQDLQANVNAVQALSVVADKAARDYGMRDCGRSENVVPIS